MKSRSTRRRAVFSAMMLAAGGTLGSAVPPAAGFCIGHELTKWATGYTSPTLRVHFLRTAWQSPLSLSVSDWNGIDTISYPPPIFNTATYGNWDLLLQDFSNAGWEDAPGVTFNNSNVSPHTVSAVYLNSDYIWYTDGTMSFPQKKADVRTVATHEFGHSAGLEHTDEHYPYCQPVSTSDIAGVMYISWTKKWDVRTDDIRGIQALYP